MNVAEPRPALENSLPKESTRPLADAARAPQLALVVPALREAANLLVLLERIRCSLDPVGINYEVIIVDDDSRDGTDAIVTEIAQRDARVRLLTRTGVRGLAGAVIHGWQGTDAEILGVMDADLQHPPELLPELWRELQSGNDIVVASRYAPHGSRPNWSRFRHLLSQLAIWMTLPLQRPGIRVKDPMSGFFLVRRACIRELTLQSQGFKILLEILVRGNVHSAAEVPFVFGHRHAGRSKASLKVGFEYVALLRRLWKVRRR